MLLCVLLGGMLGTGLRLAIDGLLPHADSDFPLGTLLINVVGSFTLALLVAAVWSRPATPEWFKAGLGVGLLGAFTTFSAVAVSVVALSTAEQWMLAVTYLTASVALGLAAAVTGLLVGGRLARASGTSATVLGVDE